MGGRGPVASVPAFCIPIVELNEATTCEHKKK
ncbi:hypothetical protein SAMN05216357_13010 [Porphyromonadaceae bacterium KH3CP3RA]|nr:hypothetical protein SAMN05216357_13010 [Porphyromonadaceae bacterium KH3CP3RA]